MVERQSFIAVRLGATAPQTVTLPGEVGVVALSRTYGRRRVNRKKSVFCFHHSRSIGARLEW